MPEQMPRRLLSAAVLAILAVGLLWLAPVLAQPSPTRPPRPPQPTRPPQPPQPTHPRQTTTTLPATTTTVEPTTTTSTTLPPTTTSTTTLPPTTTTVAPTTTTTLAGIFLEGTAPVTDQGLILYGLDFTGLPIPGGNPPVVRECPAGTVMDFEASTFTELGGLDILTVELLTFANPTIIVNNSTLTEGEPTTSTIQYRIACVPA